MLNRQALFFDGIRFAIEAADVAHQRLRVTLQTLSGKLDAPDPMHAETPAAIVDAWSIVDSVHRLRGLLLKVPGLVKRQRWPAYRAFEEQSRPVEALRNAAQHLDTEIEAIATANWPVWGVLHWFILDGERRGGRICTLVGGRIVPESVTPIPVPAGRAMPEEELPLGLITLSTHIGEICLSDTMLRLKQVAAELEASLAAQQGADIVTTGSDVLIGVEIKFTEQQQDVPAS
jgi:hypothetical protein